jgi:hypothetical protein
MKMLIRRLRPLVDLLLLPAVYPAALLLKLIRKQGVQTLPRCKAALLSVGVFPVRNHYYEPQFDHRGMRRPFADDRPLPGIDWNVPGQLRQLERLTFAAELAGVPGKRVTPPAFHFGNGQFESGDAEYWYQLIRATRPRRIFEIGSGNSTLMALKALRQNCDEDPGYECRHLCVEPYEMPWLEQTGVTVVRQKVEDVGTKLFEELEAGDILFIDSSHVVRPQGDVLFEYLELLPSLRAGVTVHIHDIFSPRDYPRQWIADEVRLWNEQYLLEAFLTHNDRWQVVGALNYLHHHHHDRLKAVAPYLTPDREPGSFYLRKVA